MTGTYWNHRVLLAALFAVTLAAPAVATPRYDLRTGTHLVYRRVVRLEAPQGGLLARQTEQLQFWVLSTSGRSATVLGELTSVAPDGSGVCQGGLVFTVDERGKLDIPDEFLADLGELSAVMAPWLSYPPALHGKSAWQSVDTLGRTWQVDPLGRDPADRMVQLLDLSFDTTAASSTAAVLGQRFNGKLFFDTQIGVFRGLEGTLERRDGAREVIKVELFQRDEVSADWLHQRTRELEKFRQVLRLQQRYADALVRTPREADRLLKDVGRFWSELAYELQNKATPVRRLVNLRRTEWQESLADWQQRALLAESWAGDDPPSWSLQSESGATVQPNDLGSGWLLEYVWSPDDAVSVAGLRGIGELAAELPDERIQVVTIQLDGPADLHARVAGVAGRDVTVLRSAREGTDESLLLPLVRLRDERGRIVRVHFGPRPVWEQWLSEWRKEADE